MLFTGRDEIDGVNDVGVVEGRREPSFAQKEIDELGLPGKLGQQLLENHLFLKPTGTHLLAKIDRTHPALGKVFENNVAIDWGALRARGHRSSV